MTQNKVSLMGKYVVLCYKSLVKRAEKVGLFWAQLYAFYTQFLSAPDYYRLFILWTNLTSYTIYH